VAFPTATVTQGSGLTINTLPNAGQSTMANSLPVVIASDQNTHSVTALNSGSITNPTAVCARNANVVSATVSFTAANPCVFTWTGGTLPLLGGQAVQLSGTMPGGGAFTAGTPYYVEAVVGNTFQLSAGFFGTPLASTSAGSCTANFVYAPNSYIQAASPTPFIIANSGGGVIIPRVRLLTNAPSGWDKVGLSINLWLAAPGSYLWLDGGPYAPLTGAAGWLANFLVTLTQFGDGAVGAGGLTGANQMALKLASGTSVYWDLQILNLAAPLASQTFTLIPELLN